jgi:hypothetical protein
VGFYLLATDLVFPDMAGFFEDPFADGAARFYRISKP